MNRVRKTAIREVTAPVLSWKDATEVAKQNYSGKPEHLTLQVYTDSTAFVSRICVLFIELGRMMVYGWLL
jgi:hypothetical protein